ncbi:hypothetical protein B0H34DRAFT_795478 [Crassisporium funariophilum]|nr:hypothetical protein B0H34DRAFT_795478 [Crassisporium funariophilum]
MPVVNVDDNDSRIRYVGDWMLLSGNSREYQSTVHSAWRDGFSATFEFRGTSVTVYSTIPAGDFSSSSAYFRIDNGRSTRISWDVGDYASYGVKFFESGPLQYGDHTLVISEHGEDIFRLDLIQYDEGSVPGLMATTPTLAALDLTRSLFLNGLPTTGTTTEGSLPPLTSPPPKSSSTFSSLPQTHTSGPTQPQDTHSASEITVTQFQTVTTAGQVVNATALATPPNTTNIAGTINTPATNHFPVGAIVGATIGGILSLLVLILLILLVRRNRRERAKVDNYPFAASEKTRSVSTYLSDKLSLSRKSPTVVPYTVERQVPRPPVSSLPANASYGYRKGQGEYEHDPYQRRATSAGESSIAPGVHVSTRIDNPTFRTSTAYQSSVVLPASPRSQLEYDDFPEYLQGGARGTRAHHRYPSGETTIAGPATRPNSLLDPTLIPPEYQTTDAHGSGAVIPPDYQTTDAHGSGGHVQSRGN